MVKKHLLSFFFIATLAAAPRATVQAQTVIGMGTEQPNPNAVLELVPEQGNQGFLAPRLTTAQRQAASFTGKLSRADHGLLVFDINEGQFYYWFDGAWRKGTSGGTGSPTSEISGTTWYTGTTAPSGVDAAEGDFYINESTGEVFKFDGNAFVSMGSIKGGPAANSSNLSSVLQQGSSASNQKITDLGTPTEDNDAATKAYVDKHSDADNQSLENVLTEGNSAGRKQIIQLASPTEEHHATNRKYVDDQDDAVRQYVDTQIGGLPTPTGTDSQPLNNVLGYGNDADNKKITGLKNPDDPQDAATKNYVDSKATITDFSISDGTLTIIEGGNSMSASLPPATPTSLNEGHLFVGNTSDEPIPVTISGDLTIAPDGTATIGNLKVTTAKIVNAAVTKEKINADVAGPGLAKDTNVEGLRVNVGSGLIIDSDEVKISPFPEGWIGIGQGLGNDMDFKEVKKDATLNNDGELTVRGIRGRAIANTAPDIDDVLQWDGSAWAPTEVTGGAGAPGTVDAFSGSGDPSGGSGSKGDIYVKDDGTVFIKTKDNSSPGSWSSIPKTFFGNGSPGGQGNQGDIYIRSDGTIYIKGANGWVDVD